MKRINKGELPYILNCIMQGHNERGCKIITRKMSAKQQEVEE